MPPLVPVLETQNLFYVQSVLVSAAILRDPVDQHRDFGYGWIHPVAEAQFEWQRNHRESFRPIGLDPAVLDLLCARYDLR